jgi:pimeloyl-ACP methyl ester carboxylesterase
MLKLLMPLALLALLHSSCKKSDDPDLTWSETKINTPTHQLAVYTMMKNSEYLVVFETGLGNDHSVWNSKSLSEQIGGLSDVLLYDRAGYAKSDKGPAPRNITNLCADLEVVINNFLNGRKVILVGHSLGGMIIRDYAIKNPDKTAAILFVDPSHEHFNQPNQEVEDMIYNDFYQTYGPDFGGTMEARELIEDTDYMGTLDDLIDVPVIVLTSMKTDEYNSEEDKQKWYNAHELLKTGVSDFTHITTMESGHFIMVDEPGLIIDNIKALLGKL